MLVHQPVAATKRKTVISADREHLGAVEALVREGRYPTVSHFVRDAVSEKLARLREERLAEQVSRYCDAGTSGEDDELVTWQAFPDVPKAKSGGRRAKR
jgi:Arc/MetJ-type ribon-helix-helix transcriptional regulator